MGRKNRGKTNHFAQRKRDNKVNDFYSYFNKIMNEY